MTELGPRQVFRGLVCPGASLCLEGLNPRPPQLTPLRTPPHHHCPTPPALLLHPQLGARPETAHSGGITAEWLMTSDRGGRTRAEEGQTESRWSCTASPAPSSTLAPHLSAPCLSSPRLSLSAGPWAPVSAAGLISVIAPSSRWVRTRPPCGPGRTEGVVLAGAKGPT